MRDNKILIWIILLSILFMDILSLVYSENLNDKQLKETNKQNISKEKKIPKKQIRKPARFIPSEKINADSSVSFPVDI